MEVPPDYISGPLPCGSKYVYHTYIGGPNIYIYIHMGPTLVGFGVFKTVTLVLRLSTRRQDPLIYFDFWGPYAWRHN